MAYEFGLPDLGEGLTEAEIIDWLVEPGETVAEDQPILEVETDKALTDIPSPVAGTVQELCVEEGEFVEVGETLVILDEEAEPADEADDDTTESESDGETEAAGGSRRSSGGLAIDLPEGPDAKPEGEAEPASAPEPESATAAEPSDAAEAGEDTGGRTRTLATPATRQLAHEKDIELDEVPTDKTRSGEAFVTADQVEAYAEGGDGTATAETAAEDGAEPDAAATGTEDERIPYRGVRRSIGEQMERAKFTAPHVSHHDEADVTALVELREQLRPHAESRDAKLTYLPFAIKAVVAGLEQHPILNARLDEENDEIVLRSEYNVGIAVATEAGLMVPVVEDADRKGLLELARGIDDLATRARDRSIDREEMQGGTFSITNFGRIGGEYSTPIINYPEVAILGLGEIKPRPRVVDGEVVPRTTLPLSISIDHRVVDGADAARFVNTVIEYLESPELLLLEC